MVCDEGAEGLTAVERESAEAAVLFDERWWGRSLVVGGGGLLGLVASVSAKARAKASSMASLKTSVIACTSMSSGG